MEVSTFLNIFNVTEQAEANLTIPKGISSLYPLPTSHVVISYPSKMTLFGGSRPSFAEVFYTAPDFQFMPEINLQNVSGSFKLNLLPTIEEIDIYLNSYSVVENANFSVSV